MNAKKFTSPQSGLGQLVNICFYFEAELSGTTFLPHRKCFMGKPKIRLNTENKGLIATLHCGTVIVLLVSVS